MNNKSGDKHQVRENVGKRNSPRDNEIGKVFLKKRKEGRN